MLLNSEVKDKVHKSLPYKTSEEVTRLAIK